MRVSFAQNIFCAFFMSLAYAPVSELTKPTLFSSGVPYVYPYPYAFRTISTTPLVTYRPSQLYAYPSYYPYYYYPLWPGSAPGAFAHARASASSNTTIRV